MAKKASKSSGGDNKSQAIRDYMTANPEDGPTLVANKLNEREGWEITPAYVSTIKNKEKEKAAGGRGRKAGRRAGRPSGGGSSATGASSSSGINAQALLEAKKLAQSAGGISEAKAALDLWGKLTS